MTQLTTVTDTYRVTSTGGNREDLEDVIWDLFPTDSWALTNLERTKADGTFHEWLNQKTNAAAANRQIEGDDLQASATQATAPTRMGNYCQISRKDFLISRTQEKVAKAGRKSEVARQAMLKMRELKNDMEYAIVTNQASSAGGSATARSLAGMESWLATTDNSGNGVRATTTAAASTAGYSGGTVAAPTDGTTTGALAEAKFKEMLSLAWADGGNPEVILVGSTQKAQIGTYTGIATKYNDVRAGNTTTLGTVDIYVSDFGTHKIVLHRHVRSSVVLAIDPDYWAIGMLDAPFVEELAKTGDGIKKQMIAEYTLICRNPDASAKAVACA